MKLFLLIITFLLDKKIKAQDEEYETNPGIMPRGILFSPSLPSENDNVYYDETSSDEVSKAWNSLFNETDDNPLILQTPMFHPGLINNAIPTSDKLLFANSQFTPTIYRQIYNEIKPNFFFSPLSLFLELLLLQSGSVGQSAEELKTLLNTNYDRLTTGKKVSQLLKTINKKKSLAFHSTNKIYIQKFFKIKNQFRKTAGNIFQASIENIDFTKTSEAAAKINTWVSKKTNKKIKKLINPTTLNGNTKGLIINTLYLTAKWQIPFSSEKTQLTDFHVYNTKTISVTTMDVVSSFNYGESANAKFLKMFFSREVGSMIFVLPGENTLVSDLENQIEDVLSFKDFNLETVHVTLPKFKVEVKLDFKTALKELGVRSIFDNSKADLSNIAGNKSDLIIDRVNQKAFLSVNENGIEVAAGTTSAFELKTLLLKKREFFANRPFLFYIEISNIIVFVGRIVNPLLDQIAK